MVFINSLTTVELFCGCGGLACGFLGNGFDIILANDSWKPALKTYGYNHSHTTLIEGDITKTEIIEKIYQEIGDRKVDVVIGSPPCTAYSVAGKRNADDPRGKLYRYYFDVVRHLQPKIFVMENVSGLSTMRHFSPSLDPVILEEVKKKCEMLARYKQLILSEVQRPLSEAEQTDLLFLQKEKKYLKHFLDIHLTPLLELIQKEIDDIGYTASWKVLNAIYYGVPQNRERLFFIGTKEDVNIDFPKRTHIENPKSTIDYFFKKELPTRALTVRDAVQDIIESPIQNDIPNHNLTEWIPIHKQKNKKYMNIHKALEMDKPSRTILTDGGTNILHPHIRFERNGMYRRLSVRELARLQGFFDEFIFRGSISAQYKQVGNAVPPPLASVMAKHIKKFL